MKKIEHVANEGFISISRKAMNMQFKSGKHKTSSLEMKGAWLMLLAYVNHSPAKLTIHDKLVNCRRGQSIMRIAKWSELFGWKRDRTRRFFDFMEKEGLITTSTYKYHFCLQVNDYDRWVLTAPQKAAPLTPEEVQRIEAHFDEFWHQYARLTGMPKTDRTPSLQIWKTMTDEHRQEAIDNIQPYVDSRGLIMHMYSKTAKMYLKEQCYLL